MEMTTDQAFSRLLENKLLWMQTGESLAKRRWCKHVFGKGELSENVKIDLLKRSGFHIEIERKWGHHNLI